MTVSRDPVCSTPLGRAFHVFGLKPTEVVAVAERLARERELPGAISRQHLGRLRRGRASATEDKILLLVLAIRELTGVSVRAAELFSLEPALALSAFPALGELRGRNLSVPVFSRPQFPRRLFVPDDSGASGAEAFDALYNQYGLLLRSIAMRRFGVPPDDAEALVHDTFVAYLGRHTHIREVKPWLMGAVGNSCRHYWRDRKREAPLPEGYDPAQEAGSTDDVEEWSRRITLAAILARLGERCRETLHRYYWRDETKESIAKRLSTSPGNVLQILVTCRRRVKDLLTTITGKRP